MATKAQKIAALTPRARKLWDRLCQGHFYRRHDDRTPKAMAELEAAGLVRIMARPVEIWVCFVPVGSRPMRPERIGS